MVLKSTKKISATDQAIIKHLSKLSPTALFLWALDAEPENDHAVYHTHYRTIIANVASRQNLVLNPRIVETLKAHVAHHNRLVTLAVDLPEPSGLRDHAFLTGQDWSEYAYLGDAKLALLELVSKGARQAAPMVDGEGEDRYKEYLPKLEAEGATLAVFQEVALVVMSRLDLYKGTLNPFAYHWTFEHVVDVVYRHDLDWLVDVLRGNAPVLTALEGEEMDKSWAEDVRQRKEKGGWGAPNG